MKTPASPSAAPSGERAFRIRRDSYGWLAGDGHRRLLRGSLLRGRLLRSNDLYQKLVLETREGVLSVNAEDVEALTNP